MLTLEGIDDLCLKYFVEAGAMAVRRVTKEDMKRIAKATGATMALTLSNMEGEETFDASMLGYGTDISPFQRSLFSGGSCAGPCLRR